MEPAHHTFFWYPPEDPDKPTFPYHPGFSAQIHRHAPPPAYATPEELEKLGHEERPSLKEEYLKTVTQSEAVALHPPADGIPLTHAEKAQLSIMAPIAIGANQGAQLVECTVSLEDGHRFTACAKIYDPLYYNFQTSIGYSPRDCVWEADEDYIVETWAYNFLEEQTGQPGSFAPRFYGSWTFTLPITLKARGLTVERPVRLILIERLYGNSIQGSRVQNNPAPGALTDSYHFPEEYRLEVLARAMDVYVKQRRAGIEQNDFAGRNIVLVPSDGESESQSDKICGLDMPRVVLVDYNNATPRTDLLDSEQVDSRPKNPALMFWRQYLWEDVAGWVPGGWKDVDVQQEWLVRRFCRPDQQELYRSLPEWLLERWSQQQETTAEAARPNADLPATTAGSTTTSSSQNLVSGDENKAPTTVAGASRSASESDSDTESAGDSKSAENWLPAINPPVVEVGPTEYWWGPDVSPFVEDPPQKPIGRLFKLKYDD